MPNSRHGSDAINLEEAFFAQENSRLLEEMRRKSEKQDLLEALRSVVSIKDEAFLNRLVALGVTPQTAIALRLIPLVFVAWADGAVDLKEREAIIKAAAQHGVAAESASRTLLDQWLQNRPDASLLALWKGYVKRIWTSFTPDEQWPMRQNLLQAAKDVAQSAGGFLGLATISAAEQAVLDDLDQTVA